MAGWQWRNVGGGLRDYFAKGQGRIIVDFGEDIATEMDLHNSCTPFH